MEHSRRYFFAGYGTFFLFISVLTETEMFGAIPGVKVIFDNKWVITLLVSIIVSGQGLFINHVYNKSLSVPQVTEVKVSKRIRLIMACIMFVFAILAEKNVESTIPFVCSAIGIVGYVYCVERLTGWPTFGLPEVLSAVVMEPAQTLPSPVNYATVIIAGVFVVRKTLGDKVGRTSNYYVHLKQRWVQKLLLVGTTVFFEWGLFALSMTKLASENLFIEDWYSFAFASFILITLHLWLCKTLVKKIQMDKKLERVDRLLYVVVCILLFVAAYIANGNVEKSLAFVVALLFFLIDMLLVHILCGVPQFGLLEIVAAMMVGTAYDVEPIWLCFVTFGVGLSIIVFNCHSVEDNQISTTTPTSASSPSASLSHQSSPSSSPARLSHQSSSSVSVPINTSPTIETQIRSTLGSPDGSDTESGLSRRRRSTTGMS